MELQVLFACHGRHGDRLPGGIDVVVAAAAGAIYNQHIRIFPGVGCILPFQDSIAAARPIWAGVIKTLQTWGETRHLHFLAAGLYFRPVKGRNRQKEKTGFLGN